MGTEDGSSIKKQALKSHTMTVIVWLHYSLSRSDGISQEWPFDNREHPETVPGPEQAEMVLRIFKCTDWTKIIHLRFFFTHYSKFLQLSHYYHI